MDIDVLSPDSYVPGVPHHMFRWLRQNAPVYWHPEPGKRGFWVITKYEDVVTISRDPHTFSSASGTNIQDYEEEMDREAIRYIPINMDPPLHNKFRALVRNAFLPRSIQRLEGRIRERVARIFDRIGPRGECDFVSEVAALLPLQVIAELVGIPEEDCPMVFDWSNRLIGFDDPEFQTSLEDGRQAATMMWAYADQLASERAGTPGDDLIRALMNGEVDGERLSTSEFTAFFLLLVVAGNETTRNAISGGMLALSQHPAERARLWSDPSLVPTAIEEMIRWVSPVMYFRRTLTRDYELHGQKMCAGDKLAMYYTSANRDEDIFAEPERFDVGRKPNPHLAFGIGQHFCLGNSLAPLEMKIFFEELIRRFPDIDVSGAPRRLRSNFINGIKEMHVRFTPERAVASM
jgi:cytochrome P450